MCPSWLKEDAMWDTFEISANAQRIATARVALKSASSVRGGNPAVCDEARKSHTNRRWLRPNLHKMPFQQNSHH